MVEGIEYFDTQGPKKSEGRAAGAESVISGDMERGVEGAIPKSEKKIDPPKTLDALLRELGIRK